MSERRETQRKEKLQKAERPSYDESLFKRLSQQAQLESEAAVETLARAATTVDLQLRDLRLRIEQGTIGSDEVRAVPSLASNLRRICEALGVTQKREEEEEELF